MVVLDMGCVSQWHEQKVTLDMTVDEHIGFFFFFGVGYHAQTRKRRLQGLSVYLLMVDFYLAFFSLVNR